MKAFDRTIAFLILAASLLCASGSAFAQKPLKKVRIALGSPVLNVTYPWLMLPVALGYWKEEGYDVEVISVAGSSQGLQQLATGGVEFAQLNSTALIQANTESGIPVRGIMANGVIDWGLAVMDGSPVQHIRDLKGKAVGISSLATGGYALLKGLLAANGLAAGTDVQVIATGAGAPALDALKNNRVQALMFWDSALVSFQNQGIKLRVFRDPEWRRLPDYTFATMQKTIDADPAMVEAIVRGAAKATVFAWAAPECARRVHWNRFPETKPTGADAETLAKWDLSLLTAQLTTLKQAYELNGGKHIGAIDPAPYNRFEDLMFQDKQITKKIDAKNFLVLNPKFFENANRFDRNQVAQQAQSCKLS